MLLILEILALVIASTFITTPLTFGYLLGTYILSKIARSWFRGCLPNSGGGGSGILGNSGDGDNSDFDSSDHPDDWSESEIRRRRAAANSAAGLPVIKLLPLGSEVSTELERVMAKDNNDDDNNNNDQRGDTNKEEESSDSDNSNSMDHKMQAPKLKKKYQKQNI